MTKFRKGLIVFIMRYSGIFVLLQANIRSHWGRFLAACIAIALVTCVLLVALMGYRTANAQVPLAAEALLDRDELHLAATDSIHTFIDESLLAEIRKDPRLKMISTAVTVRAVDMPGTESGILDRDNFYSMNGNGMGGWITGRRDAFLAWDGDVPRGTILEGRFPQQQLSDVIEIVVRRGYSMGQKVGSWRRLESDAGVFRAKIVGMTSAASSSTYSPQEVRLMSRQISQAAAERLTGGRRAPSDARLTFKRAEDLDPFLQEWQPKLSAYLGHLQLWDRAFIKQASEENPQIESARIAALTGVALAGACVACIALAVQGAAVRSQTVKFSLLRSLGADSATLVLLVLSEAFVLAVAGLLLALGLNWGASLGLGVVLPALRIPAFPDGVSLTIAGSVVLMGTLLGSIWSAWVVSQASPADIYARLTDPELAASLARRSAFIALCVGLSTLSLIIVMPTNTTLRAWVAVWIGLPGLAVTVILLTPLVIRLINLVFANPISWLTRTNSLALRDQVAGDGARSAGSVVAVAVGLGSYFLTLCWGASMLNSFMIDPQIPRWLVSIHPYGLDKNETDRLLQHPQLKGFQPLTLFDTRLGDQPGIVEEVPTLVMGVKLGYTPSIDGLPFRFVAGDPNQAMKALSEGNACLISDWYATSNGVGVGSRIVVASPSAQGPTNHTYQVAGVVELRGWRIATKQNKVRHRGNKHRVLIVLGADTVRRDFPVAYVNFLIGDPEKNVDGRTPGYRHDLPISEALAASATERESLEAKVASIIDTKRSIQYQPDGGPSTTLASRVVQVDDQDHTRNSLFGDWGAGTVKRLAWLPLFALGLSLLSVIGTLATSLRSRSLEMGILRSLGLPQSGIIRLTLAESILQALAAIPIAALFGMMGAWILLEVTTIVGYRLDFAGIKPEFTIPWFWFWPGVCLTFVVCGVAAIWAGWRFSRVPPAILVTDKTL
ncbi:MAG: ABC transporter permease [Gemmatales bacterium]